MLRITSHCRYPWMDAGEPGGGADAGLPLLEYAREKLSDVAEVSYHYAVALHKTGAAEDAQQLLKQLLSDGKPFEGREDAMKQLSTLG